MVRFMYDGITPSRIPAGAKMVASYVDGLWPNYAQAVALFPDAVHVSIATSVASDAQVLDVERGDGTPQTALPWVLTQRARGRIPTVYCNTSTWPQVQAVFAAAKKPVPYWWSANYNGEPVLWPGAISSQYETTAGFDLSVVADFWPGVDPTPPPPPKPHPTGVDPMYEIVRDLSNGKEYQTDQATYIVWLPTAPAVAYAGASELCVQYTGVFGNPGTPGMAVARDIDHNSLVGYLTNINAIRQALGQPAASL